MKWIKNVKTYPEHQFRVKIRVTVRLCIRLLNFMFKYSLLGVDCPRWVCRMYYTLKNVVIAGGQRGQRHRRWCEQAGYPYRASRYCRAGGPSRSWSIDQWRAQPPTPRGPAARHDRVPPPCSCAPGASDASRPRRKTALPRRASAFPSTDRQTTNSRRMADSKWRTCILWAHFANYGSRQLLYLTARPLSFTVLHFYRRYRSTVNIQSPTYKLNQGLPTILDTFCFRLPFPLPVFLFAVIVGFCEVPNGYFCCMLVLARQVPDLNAAAL